MDYNTAMRHVVDVDADRVLLDIKIDEGGQVAKDVVAAFAGPSTVGGFSGNVRELICSSAYKPKSSGRFWCRGDDSLGKVYDRFTGEVWKGPTLLWYDCRKKIAMFDEFSNPIEVSFLRYSDMGSIPPAKEKSVRCFRWSAKKPFLDGTKFIKCIGTDSYELHHESKPPRLETDIDQAEDTGLLFCLNQVVKGVYEEFEPKPLDYTYDYTLPAATVMSSDEPFEYPKTTNRFPFEKVLKPMLTKLTAALVFAKKLSYPTLALVGLIATMNHVPIVAEFGAVRVLDADETSDTRIVFDDGDVTRVWKADEGQWIENYEIVAADATGEDANWLRRVEAFRKHGDENEILTVRYDTKIPTFRWRD